LGLSFLIVYNGSAMVSTGIKSSEFPIKHLAKTFYFVLSFFFIKPNQKDLADLIKALNFGLSTKTRINYSHCWQLAFLFTSSDYNHKIN
ncbi:hypothetical protein CXF67_08045, partial [Psychroflexus sp. MES1-P1E]